MEMEISKLLIWELTALLLKMMPRLFVVRCDNLILTWNVKFK